MGVNMTNWTGTLLLWGHREFPGEDKEKLHYHKLSQDTDGQFRVISDMQDNQWLFLDSSHSGLILPNQTRDGI